MNDKINKRMLNNCSMFQSFETTLEDNITGKNPWAGVLGYYEASWPNRVVCFLKCHHY